VVPADTLMKNERTASKPSQSAAQRRRSHRIARRLLDAFRFAAAIVACPLSRRPVRPRGDEARRALPGDELVW
jgi:hypothetical protein